MRTVKERLKRLEHGNMSAITANIFLIGLCFAVIIYLIFLGVKSFYPEPEQVIRFEVTGIINSTNATSLVSFQYECIKFCVDELKNFDKDRQYKCYEQCSKLGK